LRSADQFFGKQWLATSAERVLDDLGGELAIVGTYRLFE
jgi:hypothetical protein